jgi:orotidine-5'-phosphate decarboxylase
MCSVPVDSLSFETRAETAGNAVAKRLMKLMAAKQTNLCIALDFQHSSVLLEIACKVRRFGFTNICCPYFLLILFEATFSSFFKDKKL